MDLLDLNTADLDFDLPIDRIAKHPMDPRDQAKLLYIDAGQGRLGHWTQTPNVYDKTITDLVSLLSPQDLLVVNQSKVLPVRLLGRRCLDNGDLGGQAEILLLQPVNPQLYGRLDEAMEWKALGRFTAKTRPGLEFDFDGVRLVCLSTEAERKSHLGEMHVRFTKQTLPSTGLLSWLEQRGRLPLPPYIPRDQSLEDAPLDKERYQTVFAQDPGSAAAPTAGLHFTPQLIARLQANQIQWGTLTLHVGLGTFKPVQSEKLSAHAMHEEIFEVSAELAKQIHRCQSQGGRVIAVGTTSLRALEAWHQQSAGMLTPGQYKTSIFIRPGFEFQVVDDLLTNFHLPKSTLLALVAAALHRPEEPASSGLPSGLLALRDIYQHALGHQYRFLSYGDAMLIRGKPRKRSL